MIVVFGSMNADLVFRVPSLPRAGETVMAPAYEVIPGGKGGNQAAAAARAGAEVRMAGQVGDDAFGRLLVSSLEGAGVDVSAVVAGTTRTGCAAICVDPQAENQIAVAGGANLEARSADVPDGWLSPKTILMMQMEVTPDENWALAARARKAGARVILNAAPATTLDGAAFGLLDVLIVNEIEAITVAGAAGVANHEPDGAAQALAERFGIACIVTLGGRGAAGFEGGRRHFADPLPVVPVDSTGAGDAFCGVFAASLDAGMGFDEALRRAGVGGALACTRVGAQTGMPAAAEIDARFADGSRGTDGL